MMRVLAVALALFLLTCSALQSEQTRSAFSQAFLKHAIAAIDDLDAAYKSVLNRDPDAIYVAGVGEGQKSLVSLRGEASARQEKAFLKPLYSESNVIGMMRNAGDNNTDQFQREAGIAVQCSIEAKLKVEPDSIAGQLPKGFRSGQCLAQMDALARSIE